MLTDVFSMFLINKSKEIVTATFHFFLGAIIPLTNK